MSRSGLFHRIPYSLLKILYYYQREKKLFALLKCTLKKHNYAINDHLRLNVCCQAQAAFFFLFKVYLFLLLFPLFSQVWVWCSHFHCMGRIFSRYSWRSFISGLLPSKQTGVQVPKKLSSHLRQHQGVRVIAYRRSDRKCTWERIPVKGKRDWDWWIKIKWVESMVNL